uniref:Uncharacterized protein n=1 Tax=Panagrolaimus davidi TaxID=227884 RepID=A0A914QIW1_9BILA
MKEHIEFFLSTESNKFVYKDIKILKIPFCNSFVQHKNLLIYYSSNDSSENGVLSFSTEKDCKEIYLDRLKHQVTVKQEVIADDLCTPSSNKKFIDDILYALDNAVKNNSNVPENLKRDIAQMLNQPSQKEVAKNGFSSDIEVQTNQNSPKTIQSPVDEIM